MVDLVLGRAQLDRYLIFTGFAFENDAQEIHHIPRLMELADERINNEDLLRTFQMLREELLVINARLVLANCHASFPRP